MFDSLGNLDGPVALVFLDPLSGLLFQFRMLRGAFGFPLRALGALLRGPRFSLFGFLGVAGLRGLLRGAETLAEFPVL